MDYEELVKEVKARPVTQLVALFIVTAEECVKRKAFLPDGMENVLRRIIDKHTK